MFHNIRFNVLKKGKYRIEGNGIIHQLTKLWDELTQIGDGNAFVLSSIRRVPCDQKTGHEGHCEALVHNELMAVSDEGIDVEI